ncbi:DUF2178 domain-containing protein [Brevibacillus ruminantium]|uniref:DUF2178 domain-containing protein n=1 Tax=Brevibacillus ruminantium TaxID=2950604 RepID=A0ABY4WC29_9BACL|nr:DUF2178 domain-containing protein [Brevibacillus ruminantium]
MALAVKILFLIAGFYLLNRLFHIVRQEKGDERLKRVAERAGLGTVSLFITWSGVNTLLLLLQIELPVIGAHAVVSTPALLGTTVTVYLLLFAYHHRKLS